MLKREIARFSGKETGDFPYSVFTSDFPYSCHSASISLFFLHKVMRGCTGCNLRKMCNGDDLLIPGKGLHLLSYGICDSSSYAGIDFIKVQEGLSRINVKMKSQEETEINGQGPRINEGELETLFAKIDAIRDEDMLVISGSIPASLPDDMYERIMKRMQGKRTRVIVDAAGSLMMKVLQFHPFLIKPNHHELGDLFGVKLTTPQEVIPYARKLQKLGARNVLVSMAKAGAVLLDEHGQTHMSPAPQGTLVNSVGAGDSMVAGFLSGYLESDGDHAYALRKGIAAGSASAFSEDLATAREVSMLLSRMNAS